MSVFAYRGRTPAGVVKGELEAEDRRAALDQLRARGVVATAMEERLSRAPVAPWRAGRARDKHLAIYTRQFSTMIDAGLPIIQCLTILAQQTESKLLRRVTAAITLEVQGDSMMPLYRDGDMLIVEPGAQVRRGDRVVVRTNGGEVMAKVLHRLTPRSIELLSLNPEHPNRTFDIQEVDWIARIIWASQ